MTSNTKLTVSGRHKLLREKVKLVLTQTITGERPDWPWHWNTVSPEGNETCEINTLETLQKMTSHWFLVLTVQMSRSVPAITHKHPSLCDVEIQRVDMLCWLVQGMYMIYKTLRRWGDVHFPPPATDSDLREDVDIGLYHSAPYWQKQKSNNSNWHDVRLHMWINNPSKQMEIKAWKCICSKSLNGGGKKEYKEISWTELQCL